jgi:hypothetical protein
MLSLLKLGLPWDAIQSLSTEQVELILTIELIHKEKEMAAYNKK